MSIIDSDQKPKLRYFLSGLLPCPYLPDRVERKLFTRVPADDLPQGDTINSQLTRLGFRRSHDVLYRPACPSCHACIAVRVPVRLFKPSRSLRRIGRINTDLVPGWAPALMTEENYDLFMAYQTSRHPEGDMASMQRLDYRTMLQDGGVSTKLCELRDGGGKLLGCMIADVVADGLSAVYSFYQPDLSRRSLGIQLILTLIAEAERMGLAYVYLGYWIAASRKMNYKSRFQPLQMLTPQGWAWQEPPSPPAHLGAPP